MAPIAEARGKMRWGLAALLLIIFAAMVQAQTEMAPTSPTAAAPAAPEPGLAVGQLAPQFAGADQFGHTVTNETLRGSRGTIILFFRSADW